jgi:hypothetical protein
MILSKRMKSKLLLILIASLGAACFPGLSGADDGGTFDGPNSRFWVKLTSSMNTETSRSGDPITAIVMVHDMLQGARLEGTVELADKSVLRFSFHTLKFEGNTYRLQDYLMSITNSKGLLGRDDLDQRVRIDGDGGGLIAYGHTTALNEGAEIKFVAWAE